MSKQNNSFLNNNNLNMIWELVYDDILKKENMSNESLDNLYRDFYNSSHSYFNNSPNKEIQLVEINKNYILYFLDKLYNKNSRQNQSKKIQHTDLEPKTNSNYTNEAISNQRLQIFEDELTKKEDEFINLFKKDLPSPPSFKLEIDEPLKDTENLLKEMAKQRNYDMEMFNKPIKEIPDKEIPEKEISDKEIPDKEIPDKEIPEKEISDKEIPEKEISDKVSKLDISNLSMEISKREFIDLNKKIKWQDQDENNKSVMNKINTIEETLIRLEDKINKIILFIENKNE